MPVIITFTSFISLNMSPVWEIHNTSSVTVTLNKILLYFPGAPMCPASRLVSLCFHLCCSSPAWSSPSARARLSFDIRTDRVGSPPVGQVGLSLNIHVVIMIGTWKIQQILCLNTKQIQPSHIRRSPSSRLLKSLQGTRFLLILAPVDKSGSVSHLVPKDLSLLAREFVLKVNERKTQHTFNTCSVFKHSCLKNAYQWGF